MEQIKKTTTGTKRNRLECKAVPTGTSEYSIFLKETGRKDIPKTLRGKVIKRIHTLAMEKLFEGNYNIKFTGLGLLTLHETHNKKAIDRRESVIQGKEVLHRNTHSDGIIYKIRLHTQQGHIPNLRMYSFRAMRNHKRRLCQVIKNNEL